VLRVAAIVPVTEAEGPGRRFALWVQGCSIRCAGCCNPHLFDAGGGRAMAVSSVVDLIRRSAERIEGITLLGGEPFEQAGPLSRVARGARDLGLSVMTFSGYTLDELRSRGGAEALLAQTDLLVDGRYDAAQPETGRRWAGSANQRFHFLTARYSPGIELGRERMVEITLGGGRIRANGWPALLKGG